MIYEAIVTLSGWAITILICLIIATAFFQPNAPRLYAALVFVGVTALHEVFFSNYEGMQYYGSAALFDLAIIIIASGINPVPKMVLSLQKICIVSIVANLAGWIMWFLYYPPIIYDLAFVAIYAWTLIILIKRTGANVGGYTMDSWATCFRFNRSAWYLYLNRNAGQI